MASLCTVLYCSIVYSSLSFKSSVILFQFACKNATSPTLCSNSDKNVVVYHPVVAEFEQRVGLVAFLHANWNKMTKELKDKDEYTIEQYSTVQRLAMITRNFGWKDLSAEENAKFVQAGLETIKRLVDVDVDENEDGYVEDENDDDNDYKSLVAKEEEMETVNKHGVFSILSNLEEQKRFFMGAAAGAYELPPKFCLNINNSSTFSFIISLSALFNQLSRSLPPSQFNIINPSSRIR